MLLMKKQSQIMGVSWDKAATPTLTRTDSAIGMVAAAGVDTGVVTNNFDAAPIFREIYDVTDTLGNVFVRIPKFYIRKTDGAGYKTWQISKTQYAGFYLPWCFWDFANSRELPYFDFGKYKATKDGSNKLQSVANVYPLINTSIADMRTYAKNNNTGGLAGYQQLDLHAADVLQALIYTEFATIGSQSIMAGYTAGQYNASHTATVAENNVNRIIVANATAALYAVGQAISVGTSLGGNQIFYGRTITSIDVYDASNKAISFDGATVNIAIGNILYNTGWKNGFSANITATSGSLVSNSSGLYPCKYRGIESPWGDIWQFVDGVNITGYQAWICKDASSYASDVFASPYEQLGYVDGNTDGYVVAMGYDANYPFAALPVTVGGSDSTYYSDYYYRATGQRIARVGGSWYNGLDAGLSHWAPDVASTGVSTRIAGRLVRKAV